MPPKEQAKAELYGEVGITYPPKNVDEAEFEI